MKVYNLAPFLEQAHLRLISGEDPRYLSYLTSRGLSLDLIKKYKFGYTTVAVPPLSDHPDYLALKEETFKFKALHNTLLMPISSPFGEPVGMVIRALDWSGFKFRYRIFLNSQAKDAGALFGVREALPYIEDSGDVYITEAAIDAASLALVLPNTVSTLTSKMSSNQFWTLSMFAKRVVVVFDSDEPGRYGAEQAVSSFNGVNGVQVVSRSVPYHDINKALQVLGLQDFRKMVLERVKVR